MLGESGQEKADPPEKGPALKAESGYLPNDPAGKKPTGNQQRPSAKRHQRSTTGRGQRATRRSRSRASASATTTGGRGRGSRSRALNLRRRSSGVDVDGAVLSGRSR